MARDPYRYFRVEARELVDGLRASALDLERQASPRDALTRLLRLAHTLKGAARVVRVDAVADLAHQVEDLLAPHRDAAGPVAAETVTALLALTDRISAQVAELGDGEGVPVVAATAAPTPAPTPRPPEPVETSRVPLAALDALLDGLLRVRAGLSALPAPGAGAALEGLDRQLAELQAKVGELRLVPAHTLATTLERVARDTALLLERRVELRVRGGEVTLDAPVLAAVQEALVQVVKNAVAHGIEPPAERSQLGKPPSGRVEVSLERRAGRVVVRCSDDGRGIDVDEVRRAARARGVLPEEDAARLDLPGAIELLLRGGLTTAPSLSHAAGRGVGLDLVREVTERVSGELLVESLPRRGTTITLTVPASLASLPALEVEAGGERLLLPLDGVVGVERVRIDAPARGELVLDGAVVPFRPLAALAGLEVPGERSAWTAVVLAGGGDRAAVGVERLAGVTQALLRPLPPAAGRVPLVAGATIDTDGRALLVLDPPALVEAALAAAPQPSRRRPRPLPILIVDDSLTSRMLEETILTTAGYEVDSASSAEEGLALARERPHALFLVDVELPGMSGFDFVARTRSDPDLRRTPAVLVTSRGAPDDVRRGREAGASAHVVKSEFDERRLLDLVARLTRGDEP